MIKRRKKESEINANAWMVTFTNLVILLLAFFIVLVNMASRDQTKVRKALNSLFGSFGLKEGGQSPIGPKSGSDITVGDAPMIKEEIDFSRLQNIAITNGIVSDMGIQRETEKIIIILGNKVLFEKGGSKIPKASFEFLNELSIVLKEAPGLVELRGYADDSEILFEKDPFHSSMHLSTSRALAVLHFLMDKGKIPVNKLVAHGFGTYNRSRGGLNKKRQWNGQVEIIVNYRQKIPYHLSNTRRMNESLDYKGFLFNLPWRK